MYINSDSKAKEKSETILFWKEKPPRNEIWNYNRHKRNNSKYFKDHNGRTYDFKIRNISYHIPKDIPVFADSGYEGLSKTHSVTILMRY